MSSPESTSNPSLPYDLLVTCLARVSKLYYPTLSLVSKSFRSLLASPELYVTRSLLGRTESCLYVCLHFHSEANTRWFTLCRKPDRTLTKSSGYVLVPIDSKVLAYNPEDVRWDFVEQKMSKSWDLYSDCIIDNVLYCGRTLRWYDNKVRLWRGIKGLSGVLPEFTSSSLVKLADYDGKMAVFWNKYNNLYSEDNTIWCAVIALKRHDDGQEIWGTVEWCDPVLTVPTSTKFEYTLVL